MTNLNNKLKWEFNTTIGQLFIQIEKDLSDLVIYRLLIDTYVNFGIPINNQIRDNIGKEMENNIRITNDKFK